MVSNYWMLSHRSKNTQEISDLFIHRDWVDRHNPLMNTIVSSNHEDETPASYRAFST